MEKQSVCVVGGGITGLFTAISLSKLNLSVDLVDKNFDKNFKSLRTAALSESNTTFLNKYNIFEIHKEVLWPCSEIKLYNEVGNLEDEEILNFRNKNNIFYMISNDKIIEMMKRKIKKDKKIDVLSNIQVNRLFLDQGLQFVETKAKKFLKYNLVIFCTGSNSEITKKFLGNKYFKYSYDEVSVVTVIDHDSINNNIARQFFIEEGPLALLPISNVQTSVIWSIKNNFFQKIKNNKELFFQKKLRNMINNVYSNIKFKSKFEYSDLNFHISHKYFDKRVLILGDALHTVHPLVGQGLNMIIRDLIKLEKIINKQIDLGLDVGSYAVLSEFSENRKSNNFIYSSGIEIIKKIFLNNNKIFKNLRNSFLVRVNNNIKVKNFFIKLADKGINL